MQQSTRIHDRLLACGLIDLTGQVVSHVKIRSVLQEALRAEDVEVRIRRDEQRLGVASSGVYYPEEQRAIVFLHFKRGTTHIRLTPRRVNRLLFIVAQNAQHELIHRQQDDYTVKPFDVSHRNIRSRRRKTMVEYLNDWYEVEAYAHDLALEMKYYYPKVSPAKILKRPHRYKKLFSFQIYEKTFAGADWTPVRKALLRTAWKWMSKIKTLPPAVGT